MLLRDEDDADERERDADELHGRRSFAACEPDDDRYHRGGRRDRRDDADRSDRHPAVERGDPDRDRATRADGGERRLGAEEVTADEECDEGDRREPCGLGDRDDAEDPQTACADAAEEVADSPAHARPEGEHDRDHSPSTGLVAATASSWFAWKSTAASAVRAARPS